MASTGRARTDTVILQGSPLSFPRSLCDPKRTFQAFVSEFRGNHTHRLQMCGATAANTDWPKVFGTAPCFDEASRKVLAIRGVIACIFASHWLAHITLNFDDGYWLMYLTHWSLTVQLVYFIFLVYTTFEARNLLMSRPAFPPSAFETWVHLPWFVKATWSLFHIAMPASLLVFLLYWTLLKKFWAIEAVPDYLDLFIHGVNFLLCILDLSISRIPYYVKYCLLFFVYCVTYISFTILHYLLEVGRHRPCSYYVRHACPIYDPLDWHQVKATGILVFVVLLCIVPMCQLPIWRLVHCRRRVDLYFAGDGPLTTSSVELADSELPGTWGVEPPSTESADVGLDMAKEDTVHW